MTYIVWPALFVLSHKLKQLKLEIMIWILVVILLIVLIVSITRGNKKKKIELEEMQNRIIEPQRSNSASNEPVEISKTGVYAIEGRKLLPINEIPHGNSINAYVVSLGYDLEQVHVVPTFNSNKTTAIIFRKYTKHPVCAMAKDDTKPLTYSDIQNEIKMIDWGFEWRQLKWVDEHPQQN
jgi:hypothetical protein